MCRFGAIAVSVDHFLMHSELRNILTPIGTQFYQKPNPTQTWDPLGVGVSVKISINFTWTIEI